MEAKETVMKDKDLKELVKKLGHEPSLDESWEAQAEISYKQGRFDALEENTEAIKQAGVKKVVDWINQHKDITNPAEWQAQLKEWGL